MRDKATVAITRTQAFILAGGRGERLQPLTGARPKPVVSFGGTFRIVDFTLSNCLHSGVSRASLLTQCGHQEIVNYIQEGWNDLWNGGNAGRKPLQVLPPAPGRIYRGTADAVFQNRGILQDEAVDHVLILSGDHVYHMDYRELLQRHLETGADLTIATVEHPIREAPHFGVVGVDENLRVIDFEEKPANPRPLPSRPSMALVSMGVYVFKKSVLLKALQTACGSGLGYDFGHDIIPTLIHCGLTYAYDFRDEIRNEPRYWRDIGTLDAYYESSMDLVREDSPFDPYANDGWPSQPTRHPMLSAQYGTRLCPRIGRNCDVSGSILSAGVYIADDSIVLDSVLMPGVRVGKGVRLHRAIIEEGVQIPEGFTAGLDAEHDRRAHTVTKAGVVVVSHTSTVSKPAIFQVVERHSRRRSLIRAVSVRALSAVR